MSDINTTVMQGRLGKDPELRYLPNNTPVCGFSIAHTKRYKDQQGGKQEKTSWFDVEVFGKSAESCSQYLEKGQQATVQGELVQDQWQNKEGQNRSKVKIKAFQVSFGPKAGGGSQGQQQGGAQSAPVDGDDIPF